MYLDFDAEVIGFVINNIDYGPIMHEIETNVSYRMAVSLYGGPNEIELVDTK